MLYLDSSVLVKRYVQEAGSALVNSRFESGEVIYTSMLSYAEVHSAIGRMYRDKQLNASEKNKLVEDFKSDWFFSLTVLELTTLTMIALPTLCEQHNLKAGDAIQLSAAIWLKNSILVHAKDFEGSEDIVEFGVSDHQLGDAALQCGFRIFNPA
jgi:predicted nucleic acid-binding protein